MPPFIIILSADLFLTPIPDPFPPLAIILPPLIIILFTLAWSAEPIPAPFIVATASIFPPFIIILLTFPDEASHPV